MRALLDSLCSTSNMCSPSVEWNEVCAGTPLIRGSMRQAEEGLGCGGWRVEEVHEKLPPPAGQPMNRNTFSFKCRGGKKKGSHLTGKTHSITSLNNAALRLLHLWALRQRVRKHLRSSTTYRNPQYHRYGDECTWQLAPEQDVLVNADSGDSRRKTRRAKSVGNISAGTGHLHKGMTLGGAL